MPLFGLNGVVRGSRGWVSDRGSDQEDAGDEADESRETHGLFLCSSSVVCELCFRMDVRESAEERMENKTQIAGLPSIFLYLSGPS